MLPCICTVWELIQSLNFDSFLNFIMVPKSYSQSQFESVSLYICRNIRDEFKDKTTKM